MKKGAVLFFALLILSIPSYVNAVDLNRLNNKFGISLLQPTEDDIKKTAELVNANGGDYGYVTLVIQENDRNQRKWQDLFEQLREHHLIPIVRLATQPEGEVWRRPTKDDADEWVQFLDSLNWVVKKRYIVLFNEPNHGQEWGGEVDPEQYAEVSDAFYHKLKEKNPDFFVMLAGLDLSAPSSLPNYEDAETYFRLMFNFQPSIFKNIDGLASHSYPNPGFAGSPWDTGRKTIRGYEWELDLLKELGLGKDLPVFITETGWENNCSQLAISCQNTIANNFKIAYEQVWGTDERVVAVTPFVFNYQSPPFLGFSWKIPGDGFYQQYDTVKELNKQKGKPETIEKGTMEAPLSVDLVANSSYRFKIQLKNTGQGFWDKDVGYKLEFKNLKAIPFDYIFPDIVRMRPGEDIELSFTIKTKKPANQFTTNIILTKDGAPIVRTKDIKFIVDPLPSLNFKTTLFPKLKTNADDFELQLFDGDESLIFKKKGLKVRNGNGVVEQVQNIALGNTYRIVLLKPYYLPRQTFITFKKDRNEFVFKPMFPFDFSKDGKLDWDDVGGIFKNPTLLMNLIP